MSIARECRIFLCIDFIIGLVFGLIFILIPELFLNFINWGSFDPVAMRILGIAIIALGSGSLIASFEDTWKEVRAIIEMEVIWLLFGEIILIVCHLVFFFPWEAWFIDVIMIALLIGFIYCILKLR